MEIFFNQLRRLGFLTAADLAELDHACSDIIQLNADMDLVREGSKPEWLHILLEGWAFRYVLIPDGRRQIPVLLLPGDVVDIDALETEGLDYGVATLTYCRVALLSRSALKAAIERAPGLGRAFLALALRENARLMRRNVSLGRQTAREQLASLLCELVTRLTESDGSAVGGKYLLPLTQCQLGDVVGLSTVHVNRVLQGLRADGLARLAGKKLSVMNWAGLVDAAALRSDTVLPSRSHNLRNVPDRSMAHCGIPNHA